MSTSWKPLREDVLVADLATSDPDFEATQPQVIPVGATFVAPLATMDGGGPPSDYAFVVYAYDNNQANIAGIVTAQVIERAPLKSAVSSESKYHYVGSTPEVGIPLGRGFVVPGRNFHSLTVRLSSLTAVGATKLRVLWRHLR